MNSNTLSTSIHSSHQDEHHHHHHHHAANHLLVHWFNVMNHPAIKMKKEPLAQKHIHHHHPLLYYLHRVLFNYAHLLSLLFLLYTSTILPFSASASNTPPASMEDIDELINSGDGELCDSMTNCVYLRDRAPFIRCAAHEVCLLICDDEDPCKSMEVYSETNSALIIDCIDSKSCNELAVHAKHAYFVYMEGSDEIQCIHNHDCCICGQMICGPDCTDLICNGDSACFGVKYIELTGGAIGASINCNGDVSCMMTNIVGTNIRQMACTGDFSCAYSKFYLQCKGEKYISGCQLECVGDDACKGHPTDPTQRAIFEVSGSFGLLCSHDSCRDADFFMMNNYGGAIVCGAEAACTKSTITVNNVDGLLCGGEFGCYESNILITNPQNGFSVVCAGFAACKGLNLEILVTDPEIEWFREIRCNSAHACQDVTISINKMVGPNPATGSTDLVIEELHCGQRESCRNAMFDLGPNVYFDHCGCAGGLTLACDNILGVSACVHGLAKLECAGATSCAGLTETITNPLNDFEVMCNDAGSCSNFELTINVDGTKPLSRFKGIKCGSSFACTNMVVNVLNIGAERIDAGIISCGTPNACKNVQLNMYRADIQDVVCGDSTSCKGCMSWTDGVCRDCSSNTFCPATAGMV